MLRFTLYRSMFGAMIISSDLFIWRTHRPEKPGRLHNFTSYPGRTELLRVQLNHFWSLEGKRLNINLHRFSIKLLVKYLNIQIFNCKKILKGSVILTYLMNSLIVYWNSVVWLCCILKSRLESLYISAQILEIIRFDINFTPIYIGTTCIWPVLFDLYC